MKAVLRLEAIGDNTDGMLRLAGRIADLAGPDLGRFFDRGFPRPWVARLTGLCPRYEFRREFLRPRKDYSEANSVGSRGVYLYYWLDPGVYEVNQRRCWRAWDRYFIQAEAGQWRRISRQDVIASLPPGSEG